MLFKKTKEASSIGIIGEPNENSAKFLEKQLGKPVKIRKKGDKD